MGDHKMEWKRKIVWAAQWDTLVGRWKSQRWLLLLWGVAVEMQTICIRQTLAPGLHVLLSNTPSDTWPDFTGILQTVALFFFHLHFWLEATFEAAPIWGITTIIRSVLKRTSCFILFKRMHLNFLRARRWIKRGLKIIKNDQHICWTVGKVSWNCSLLKTLT